MTDETTKLESLSKLKKAGKLRYWRGTIEIPESELHAICDEIQVEYENTIHALNKAAGNWAKADAELREKVDMAITSATDELRKSLDFMRIWISEDAHLGESAISRELEKSEGLRRLDAIEQAIAATLGGQPAKLTAELVRELIAPHLHARPTFDFGRHGAVWRADFQAIADALNATPGRGTCRINYDRHCSNCGVYVHESAALIKKTLDGGLWTCEAKPVNYCPNCGAKVVER